MPAPNSIIPSSEPIDLVTAMVRARVPRGRARALRAYEPSVPETEFKKCFPLPFRVRAVTIYEAKRNGWATDRSYWQFLVPFRYVSPKWGPINIPKGFYTDFASVPPSLHSIIDDDSPIILFPSAPHDFLFTKRDEGGTRGWISKTKQLTLTEVNRVLTEAMSFCGANFLTRELVFNAVELANEGIRGEFAH
ncbi:MAG TPA: DUF1353 domain-containing protein [Candidatus Udaeobacter sp.]|jgi:hypothetical protein